MAKGKILQKILETLEEGILNQTDFFETVLTSGYGASMGKIQRECAKNKRIRAEETLKLRELKEKRIKLQKFISKLKHDGLIVEQKGDNPKLLISNKGKAKLATIKSKSNKDNYEKEANNNSVIISFDIPEKMRRKRDWLREVIRNFGFSMIHQSVWIGNVKIPKKFIDDLGQMNLIDFVEIFEISKAGSLKKMK